MCSSSAPGYLELSRQTPTEAVASVGAGISQSTSAAYPSGCRGATRNSRPEQALCRQVLIDIRPVNPESAPGRQSGSLLGVAPSRRGFQTSGTEMVRPLYEIDAEESRQ